MNPERLAAEADEWPCGEYPCLPPRTPAISEVEALRAQNADYCRITAEVIVEHALVCEERDALAGELHAWKAKYFRLESGSML